MKKTKKRPVITLKSVEPDAKSFHPGIKLAVSLKIALVYLVVATIYGANNFAWGLQL